MICEHSDEDLLSWAATLKRLSLQEEAFTLFLAAPSFHIFINGEEDVRSQSFTNERAEMTKWQQ